MKIYCTLLVLLLWHAGIRSQVLSRDNTFNNNDTTANANVRCIAIQADQKIVFFGDNTFYNGLWPNGNGIPINYGGRLNADGSWDFSFNPITLNGRVDDVYVQEFDQKILIAGSFTQVNGVPRGAIARLNTDGTLDASFNPGSGIGGSYDGDLRIWSIAVRESVAPANRRIYIGGHFQTYNGVPVGTRGGLACLFMDGTRDATYDPQVGNGPVYAITYDKVNDQLYAGGEFWKAGGLDKIRLARFHANGALDNGYKIGPNWWEFPEGTVTSLCLTADGKLLAGGYFERVKGIVRRGLARFNADGSLDMGFNTGAGFQNGGSVLDNGTEVRTILTLTDGSIIAGGNFTAYNGVPCGNIVKLEADGSIDKDTTFGAGFNEWVMDIKVQHYAGIESRLIAGGFFKQYMDNYYQGAIMRLFTYTILDHKKAALQAMPVNRQAPVASGIAVFPNPVGSVLMLRTSFNRTVRCKLELLDTKGALLKIWERTIVAGAVTTSFDMPARAGQGVLLRVTDNSGKLLLVSTLNHLKP